MEVIEIGVAWLPRKPKGWTTNTERLERYPDLEAGERCS